MKKIVFIFCLLTSLAYAQNPTATAQKSNSEWDVLDKTFISLVEAFTKGDQVKFIALSLSKVECEQCAEAGEYNPSGFFVPAADYFEGASKSFTKSAIYRALAKRGYGFSSVVIKNLKIPGLPANSKETRVYDVWVDTYLPNELSKGHPGTRQAFRFVKLNGKFKFYSITATN